MIRRPPRSTRTDTLFPYTTLCRSSWYQAAKRELEGPWTAPLHDAGIPVRTRIIENIHPVRALADAVEEEDAGLAVVGTRGIGGFLGLRLGRVPVQLVHQTQIPVVLVPPPTLASDVADDASRSEEHTSELQSLMRIPYAV